MGAGRAVARRGATGFSVVREFVGHGIGTALHEEPQIPNYGPAGRGPRLAEGMVLAIEPMVNVGQARGEGAVGRLDGGDEGRQTVGALRAHRGGDRRRAAGADGVGRPVVAGATATGPRRRPCVCEKMEGSRADPSGGRGRGRRPAAERAVSGERRRARNRRRTWSAIRGAISSGVLVGDQVKVMLAPGDLTRGRIVAKL